MRKIVNNIIIASLVFLAGVMSPGCDFLDVKPRENSESSELYADENGFKYALTGVYLTLSHKDLYGQNTSWYMPELLAQHWAYASEDKASNIYIFSAYDFDNYNGNTLLSTVWTRYYKAIAQLNDILENLEKTDVRFSENVRDLVEGEAYALRAFLHLEILRYWGPVPSKASAGTKAVPYLTEVTLNVEQLVSRTWKEVVDNILSDLNKAETLLAKDPITQYNNTYLNSEYSRVSPVEPWQSFRQNRMNYYAVLGTKARLYNWIASSPAYTGAASEATKYAKMVIDATFDGEKIFSLTNGLTLSYNSFICFGECLFAVHTQKLQDYIQKPLKADQPTLTQDKTLLNTAYEYNDYGSADIRYIHDNMWNEKMHSSVEYMHMNKYGGYSDMDNNVKSHAKNMVPLLRLSEMYLIMIEHSPITEAAGYFSTFRIARSMHMAVEDMFDEGYRLERLEKEYRKEFFGEGQMFFFYKRNAYPRLTWPGFDLPKGLDSYVLPAPKSQQAFEK